uniref:ABC transmembrane type-1 domain-containing protein n=1 Tax=Acrobeloides nanus TaxID=290746 RepID=A0A914DD05_9BILA
IAFGAFPLVTIQTQLKTLKNGLLTYKVNEIKTISSKIGSTKNLTITVQAKGNKNEKSSSNRDDYFTSNQVSKKLLRPNSISLLYWKLYFIAAICIVLHSLGPPIYAFLNGAYFAIFEVNKDDYMTEMKSLFKFYIIMAVLTGVALSIY